MQGSGVTLSTWEYFLCAPKVHHRAIFASYTFKEGVSTIGNQTRDAEKEEIAAALLHKKGILLMNV